MAILIIIEKILEKNRIGYYKAFTKKIHGIDFYIGIDKGMYSISYYLTNDFSTPFHIVDCNNPNSLIGEIPGVSPNILSKVFIKSFKVFELDNFPNDISYQA